MSDCFHYPPWLARCRWLITLAALTFSAAAAAQNCALICKSNVQVSLNGLGQALVNAQMIAPTAGTYCPGPIAVTLLDDNNEPVPNPITCAYVGQTVTVMLEHVATGNSCTGSVNVRDFIAPSLTCPEKFILCAQDPAPALIGLPAMSDNCTPLAALAVSHTDQFVDLPCATIQNGQPVTARLDRSWNVTDAAGNNKTCLQKIWVRRAVIADVTFPVNLDGFQSPPLNCGQDPTDLSLTGAPSLEGYIIQADGNCDLAVVHSDQVAANCGAGSYTVLRTWTISDFCGGGSFQHIQAIQVLDATPPVLTPPPNLTVGTQDLDCNALVNLPVATATDDCSAVSVLPAWSFGSGYGPFLAPAGTHTVTYTATDVCGNTTTATALVTVVDDDPPQVICHAELQVAISASGVGHVLPQSLDVGTWDNCGMFTLAISRDGEQFSASVPVTCADIGSSLPLTLRATDAAGWENFCQVDVDVRDFVKPSLSCPATAVLPCGADYSSLQLTGQAQATDNCLVQSLDFTDVSSLNACGVGSVARTWRAGDTAGNTRTCLQQIALNVVSTITVAFPPDLALPNCAGPAALLPAAAGQPVITGQSCSPVSVTYTDQFFATPPAPACFSLLRTWKVIDWCTYNPNGGPAGHWEQVQLITVQDQTPPVLTLPADQTVAVQANGCAATVVLDPVASFDCVSVGPVTHNSVFAASPGANASGLYPLGEHAVIFTATDACGNLAQRTLRITVRDQTAPLALCRDTLTLVLGVGGSAALLPSALDAGSSDNCTPANALSRSATPQVFSCDQLGLQPVLLTVADLSGNLAACQTLIDVVDPAGTCTGADTYNIIGELQTETGAPLPGTSVELLLNGVLLQTAADTAGHYLFADLPDGDGLVKPLSADNDWLNGVSTFDLVLLSKHILGIQPLTSPLKIIAADANHSNSVTTFDIVVLRKLLLGISDALPGNTSWRFVDANYVFPQPAQPFAAPWPESITFDSVGGDLPPCHFTGIKIGDLNNSVNPAATARAPQDTSWLWLPSLDLAAGASADLPVFLDQWPALEGFQFSLAFDTNKIILEEIHWQHPAVLGEMHVGRGVAGHLQVSWDAYTGPAPSTQQALFVLRLRAREFVETETCFHLSPRNLAAEAYVRNSEAPAVLALAPGPRQHAAPARPALFPSRPNPFRDETVLPFRLLTAAELTLTIWDGSGRLLLTRQAGFPPGDGAFRIRREDLRQSGIYPYRLDLGGQRIGSGFLWLQD